MHIVVFGAGAVGGVIGGRLAQHADRHGHDVTLVARGEHREVIERSGLTLRSHDGTTVVPVRVASRIGEVALTPGDVVVLAMKTQDTAVALSDLAAAAPAGITVACAQNGVENERLAARLFDDVLAICVMLPASVPEPGVVEANGAPHNAILDLGRYPAGVTAVATELAAAFEASGLASRTDPRIMRLKYRKLLMNLGNAIDALVADPKGARPLLDRAVGEALACYAAAGIECVGEEEDSARRQGVMRAAPIGDRPRGGGSTWQSLARGARTTEVDWLNGEIVLLGRLHGVPTPANVLLQDAARHAATSGAPPRSVAAADLLARLSEPVQGSAGY